ncbi:MAG: hypothetical protein WCH46_03560 [bacterium]
MIHTEPKVLVLGGNRGRWSASERASEAATMTGIESWVYAFNGNYQQGVVATRRNINDHDIIIANTNSPALENLVRCCQERGTNTKWVTLIEGDAHDYLKPRPYIRDLLDSSDLVICINKYTQSFFRNFASAKVVYLGMPYPAEGIRALATPQKQRRREIFLTPMLLTRWSEYFCTKDMGIPMYGYENRLTRNSRSIIQSLMRYRSLDPWHHHKRARNLLKDSSIIIHREEPLPQYFERNGGAYVWLSLEPRYTWGRNVLDAAALQVPIITTKATGHVEDFFPELVLENEFEFEKARMLIDRLFKDKEFYSHVTTIPLELFESFRPEEKRRQLMDLLFNSEPTQNEHHT